MSAVILFSIFIICLIITVPIAVSIGLSSSIVIFQMGIPAEIIVQKILGSLDSFVLLAVPFFILAGNLMERGGISKRLINLAYTFIGTKTGGLGIVTIVASMFFSAISGSGPATVAAIGSIMIPAMVAKGYDIRFASSTQAAAGELGIIIPPSIPLILYGVMAGVSISDLFIASIIPGIMIGLSLMLVVYIVAKRNKYTVTEESYSWRDRFIALKEASLALLMPVIILGGIYSGVFTPTEAAVVATVYALIVGVFVYKKIKWRELVDIFYESCIMSSVILLIIACAGVFSWVLTYNMFPQVLSDWISNFSTNPIVFLLLINLCLFILGMFFDVGAAMVILVPILVPVVINFGIDPVHFGIIMIVNMAMGMITPPFGVNLFVVSQIANIKVESLFKPLLLYVLVIIFNLILITYIPEISLWFR